MAQSKLYPVVMAGGSGSRLWPLSRVLYPKQFLCLKGDLTMLQTTICRLNGVECESPVVICNEQHRFIVAEQLRQLNKLTENIILEPAGRNTAPAIALAALAAKRHSPESDPLMLVLAADHVIADEDAFRTAVRNAMPYAEAGKLVTFGIVPDLPETGYGYIRRGEVSAGEQDAVAFEVAQFVEKPNLETAQAYVASGEYYWNSGMFLFRAGRYLEELKKYQADVCVVVAFGQILPKEILEMTPYGCINVHASLLPKYRGAAPIQWAVINGEKVSGVTTMQMDEGLDTGDMLEKVEITLDKKETGGSLFDKLSAKGAALCVHTLAELEKGTITPQKQGESTTEYAKMLNKKSGEIDWTKTAVEIERLIRGLNPWPSAYTQWEGKTMKIWEAEVEDVVETIDTHEPGTITEVTKHGFKVQTGEGRLAIKSLQIPGKKRMEADAFLRGYHIEEGEKLG